jgi:asparagine synthase (glutamine-hydrolysing)
MYQEYDLEAFGRCNGMFACAIWDRRSRQLVLARDRFGKKPLFYYHDGRRFVFGSELKALLAYGTIERKVDHAALHDYLSHGYVAGEHSIIAGVRRLPPAHRLVVRNGSLDCRPYWELRFRPDPAPPEEAEAAERLEILIRDAVKRRLLSDVPLGAFLSGGLDSSMVVAVMASLMNEPVKTFTIGFEESGYSEVEDARAVATHFGTDHREIIVKPSALEILPDLVWYLDEPFGDSSAVPTYYVCRAAREHVTVAISGDGGDEVFAGYTRYQTIGAYRRMQKVPSWIRAGIIRPSMRAIPFNWPAWNYLRAMGDLGGRHPSTLGIYPYIRNMLYEADFKRQVQECNAHETSERILGRVRDLDEVSRYQYLDTLEYLPSDILTKVDRMSMANSLEVRSPLLDHNIVEFMAALPVTYKLRGGVSKYLFRKVGRRILPPSALEKPKQGFAIPKGLWFRNDLGRFAEAVLLERRSVGRGFFHAGNVRRMLRHHATGRRDYSEWIWCLVVLEMWFRAFMDQEVSCRRQRA